MEDAILDTASLQIGEGYHIAATLHHASARFSFLIKPLCVDLFREISQPNVNKK